MSVHVKTEKDVSPTKTERGTPLDPAESAPTSNKMLGGQSPIP